MFNKYFQDELSYLREMGREFGLAHPALAGMLAERGGDPDVERLLEGFAFLTARVRQRADDALPEVVQGLVQLLLPQYLRPLPATSVVEFTPQLRALRSRVLVARGTSLASVPVEGTSCLFRTTQDVTLLPLQLLETTLEQRAAHLPTLRVLLQTSEQGKAQVFHGDGIRFFLHGDLPVASALLVWLTRHCQAIRVRKAGSSTDGCVLPPTALRHVGLAPEESLLPWPAFAPAGLRLLLEYFTLPEKLLFFEVRGLAEAAALEGEQFELCFDFERPPALPARLPKDVLKLHCSPVVNLFDVDAEPLRLDLPVEEHLLRASGVGARHMEVFSINDVVSLRRGSSEREKVPPFVAFEHAAAGGAAFQVRRHPSTLDEGWDTYLSLATPRDAAPALAPQTLSVSLTCTNRGLPAQLRVGDLREPTADSPALARFTNLLPVRPATRPALGSDLLWRALAHLAVNQRSLVSPGALASLVSLYNFQRFGDLSAARTNDLRIEAIREVTGSPVRRFVQGAPVRGQRTLVELEESGFAGLGDAFLFGCVLDRVFADALGINAFHELALSLHPSRRELAWAPRSGSMELV